MCEIYIRESEAGITRPLGAKIVDRWESAIRIRSEVELERKDFLTYFLEEGEALVALKLGEPEGDGPYDYVGEIDRSDVRARPDWTPKAT